MKWPWVSRKRLEAVEFDLAVARCGVETWREEWRMAEAKYHDELRKHARTKARLVKRLGPMYKGAGK